MNEEQRIRERAYLIWESEGRPYGQDAKYWRRAEIEIEQERSLADASSDRLSSAEGETRRPAQPVTSRPLADQVREPDEKPGQGKKPRATRGKPRSS
jgi:Protein of unknown function (DUF2934)